MRSFKRGADRNPVERKSYRPLAGAYPTVWAIFEEKSFPTCTEDILLMICTLIQEKKPPGAITLKRAALIQPIFP
jgi:hypothetical protein